MKKNKRCIPPDLLTKADPDTIQYAFDHADAFTLFTIAPKRNKRVVLLSTIHALPRHHEDAGKEEVNVFYIHEKDVDSHDQICALCTTARKTNRWTMRVFYGMIDAKLLTGRLVQAPTRPEPESISPNPKTNLKPKSCPKKPESYVRFEKFSNVAKLF